MIKERKCEDATKRADIVTEEFAVSEVIDGV